MDEKLLAELTALKTALETKTTSEVKSQIDAFEQKLTATNKATVEAELKSIKADFEAKLAEVQAHADKLDVKLQEKQSQPKGEGYKAKMVDAITKGFESIKNVKKGVSANLDIKDVGVMTATANLTGDVVNTVQPGAAMIPNQKVNFADLVATVNSATGAYVIYEETGGEGGFGEQTVPGNPKSQIDYDLKEKIFTANYIAGYVRIAKQMIQDLPFMTSFLPDALRRDYLKAENNKFVTYLLSVIPSLTTAATVPVEKILAAVGQLESTDYAPNGIVLNPKDWYTIAVTKPNDYSLPGVVQFQNGQLTINGIPVFKASWLAVDTAIVGDWTYAKKVQVDGLNVQFFEQDQDNVIRNLVTVRTESRVVLAVDKNAAFLQVDLGNVSV